MRAFVTLAVLLLIAAAPLRGQLVRTVALEVDNDGLNFLWAAGTADREYTHGARLRLDLAARVWGLDAFFGDAPPCDGSSGPEACILTGVELGQEIYESDDRACYWGWDWEKMELIPPCPVRPNAGWLYGAVTGRRADAGSLRDLRLEIGVTGSPSLGEAAQEWFHAWIHGRPVTHDSAWDDQLPMELAFAASYRERWSRPLVDRFEWAALAVEPSLAATLGTLRTSAEAGVALRLAGNAPRPTGWIGRGCGFCYHFSAAVTWEVILRDLFLDGSTFHDGPHVDKRVILPTRELAFSVGWGGGVLETRVVSLGQEYERQLRTHTYASLGLTLVR